MENKKQNFIRISDNRTKKIIITLQQLSNLTNTSYYEYTQEQIDQIFDQIERETEKTKKALINNLNKKDKEFEI